MPVNSETNWAEVNIADPKKPRKTGSAPWRMYSAFRSEDTEALLLDDLGFYKYIEADISPVRKKLIGGASQTDRLKSDCISLVYGVTLG